MWGHSYVLTNKLDFHIGLTQNTHSKWPPAAPLVQTGQKINYLLEEILGGLYTGVKRLINRINLILIEIKYFLSLNNYIWQTSRIVLSCGLPMFHNWSYLSQFNFRVHEGIELGVLNYSTADLVHIVFFSLTSFRLAWSVSKFSNLQENVTSKFRKVAYSCVKLW